MNVLDDDNSWKTVRPKKAARHNRVTWSDLSSRELLMSKRQQASVSNGNGKKTAVKPNE